MNTITTTILDNLIGPAITIRGVQTRFEALQPTPENQAHLDFERFLARG
ncbi:MAG: hypothetical protein H6R18_3021 [Proteobacteria bacterium]|nr:hypothetical protein [Pseudomonadota bacterium]